MAVFEPLNQQHFFSYPTLILQLNLRKRFVRQSFYSFNEWLMVLCGFPFNAYLPNQNDDLGF